MRNIHSHLLVNILRLSSSCPNSARLISGVTHTRPVRKVQIYDGPLEAIHDIQDGAKILVGGYAKCGVPYKLLDALIQKRVTDLTYVGAEMTSSISLTRENMIKRMITGHAGYNVEITSKLLRGEIEVEFIPQGTLIEMLRAGGSGIPAFYTPVGVGTLVHTGGVPIKYSTNGHLLEESKVKEARQINGVDCILAESMTGDFALVKAWKADRAGNLTFRKVSRNANPLMCKAARVTIVEAEEIVETGSIPGDDVHVPHIYVQRIFQGSGNRDTRNPAKTKCNRTKPPDSQPKDDVKHRIARRAALELEDGMCVDLGFGLPGLVTQYVPDDVKVYIHSDGGFLGIGPQAERGFEDPDIVNANGILSTCIDGGSFFAMDEAFTMSRGGHLDATILGAMEVSEHGDLANWIIPDTLLTGMGGAMDLVSHDNTKVIVTMEHTSKSGKPKMVKKCSLPLTRKGCVDTVITEMGVFQISKDVGLVMTEIADGYSVEDVRKVTGCDLKVSSVLSPMKTDNDKFQTQTDSSREPPTQTFNHNVI